MTRLSLASGMTSIRGGSTCKAPSPPRNTTCGSTWDKHASVSKVARQSHNVTPRRLQDRGRAYQVVTDKLLSKLKRAGGDVNQILQLGLRTRDWTHASNHSLIHHVGGVSDKLHGGGGECILSLNSKPSLSPTNVGFYSFF